jgi:large subunit ribosomal protein L14e
VKKEIAEIGSVVVSKAGRDKGRSLLVVGLADETNLLVADGALRKISRPKKKKRMHLIVKPQVAQDVAEKIRRGQPLLDAEIRAALENLGFCVKSDD